MPPAVWGQATGERKHLLTLFNDGVIEKRYVTLQQFMNGVSEAITYCQKNLRHWAPLPLLSMQ